MELSEAVERIGGKLILCKDIKGKDAKYIVKQYDNDPEFTILVLGIKQCEDTPEEMVYLGCYSPELQKEGWCLHRRHMLIYEGRPTPGCRGGSYGMSMSYRDGIESFCLKSVDPSKIMYKCSFEEYLNFPWETLSKSE